MLKKVFNQKDPVEKTKSELKKLIDVAENVRRAKEVDSGVFKEIFKQVEHIIS